MSILADDLKDFGYNINDLLESGKIYEIYVKSIKGKLIKEVHECEFLGMTVSTNMKNFNYKDKRGNVQSILEGAMLSNMYYGATNVYGIDSYDCYVFKFITLIPDDDYHNDCIEFAMEDVFKNAEIEKKLLNEKMAYIEKKEILLKKFLTEIKL